MYIVSPKNGGHHDYYDCIARSGYEPSIVYLRTRRTEPADFDPAKEADFQDFTIRRLKIGFCGKFYACAVFYLDNKSHYCHTVREIDKFVTAYCPKKYQQDYFYTGREAKWTYSSKGIQYKLLREAEQWEAERQNRDSNYLFIKHKAPVIVEYPRYIGKEQTYAGEQTTLIYPLVINDNLAKLEFFRVKPPQQAFQEIQQYLSSVLADTRERIPEMDNQTKINSHGFDKHSFRKKKKN